GIVSKRRQFSNGKSMGGVPMSRGAIYQILRNRLYRGEIAHRGEIHTGNHEPIIDASQWDRVQEKLAEQSARPRRSTQAALQSETDISSRTETSRRPAHLLAGLVFDGDANRLTPSHSNKSGRRYLYYVSAPLVRGRSAKSGIRVPAADLERLVVTSIAERFEYELWLINALGSGLDAENTKQTITVGKQLSRQLRAHVDHDIGLDSVAMDDPQHLSVRNLLDRVVVEKNRVAIVLDSGAIANGLAELDPVMAGIVTDTEPVQFTVPAHMLRCGKQVKLVVGQVDTETRQVDQHLVIMIADAHRWFEQLKSGKRTSIADIARREGREVSDVSRSITLAFVAPEIVEKILTGRQPVTLTAERLKACRPIVADWSVQKEHLFG
ncbi:MAG: recombinase family protein, partial [Hyphomicrobiales bacterium]|nr:recombinase family protein [Hyphomicrobiales bacterium]